MTFSWRTLIIGLLLVALVAVCRVAYFYHGKYAAADNLATERQQTIDDMQVRQRDVAALDAKYTKELADAQATIDRLHDDVASGKRRLQLNATCTKQSASGTAGMDDAASAGLTDSAERDYFTLRSRIELAGKQIAGLQQYINEQCLK
ncbi:lysis protein [Pantoea sp. ACRSB]|uniref:lysis protein n=1 Tax=Pantoea sp. ACRSB TaxID=2918207 RepID=UPI0028932B0D|nr:lysis protein [Pantoea sp. ACRSB]